MKEISGDNLVSNTLYYIQGPKCESGGNGKQKGIFIKREQMDPTTVVWYKFIEVTDVVGKSGYGRGNRSFDKTKTIFYIPENEILLYNFAMNEILRQIISDEYFINHYVNQFNPIYLSITQS